MIYLTGGSPIFSMSTLAEKITDEEHINVLIDTNDVPNIVNIDRHVNGRKLIKEMEHTKEEVLF